MDIILNSGVCEVVKIKRKSNAVMFKNLRVGDKIKFSVPLKEAGRNRGNLYATYIDIVNIGNDEKTSSSFNQLPRILEAFELSLVKAGE